MADPKTGRDPNEIISEVDRERERPGRPGQKIIQRVITFADGRQEIWQRNPGDDPETVGELIVKGLDAAQKKAWDSNLESDRKDAKAAEPKAAEPKTVEANGAVYERQPNGDYREVIPAKPKPESDGRMTEYQRAQIENQRRTDTRQSARDASSDRRAAATDRRAASREEATAEYQRLQGEYALRRITAEEAKQKFDQWLTTNVEIPMKTAEQSRRSYEADRTFNTSGEKETRRRYEDDRDFGQKVGQAAVKNTLDMMPYRMGVGPAFGEQYAAGLRTLSSGGGPVNFTADAFMGAPMPDFASIADQAAQAAVARMGMGGAPGAVPPAPMGPAPPGIPPIPPYPGPPGQQQVPVDPRLRYYDPSATGA